MVGSVTASAAGLVVGFALIMMFALLAQSPGSTLSREVAVVRIVEGASLESNPSFYDPQEITVMIGVNNTVRWVNQDNVPHSVVSDDDYRDPLTGEAFGPSLDSGGDFLTPGASYEFTFREPGRYGYHAEPHPWMQGTVVAVYR